MLLYLYVLRLVFQGLIYLFGNGNAALTVFVLLFFTTSMAASYTIHPTDLGEWVSWVKYLSPESWIFQRIVYDEFIGVEQFTCPRYPVTHDSQIVTQLDCRINSGPKALDYFGFSSQGPILIHLLSVAGIGFVFYLVGFFSFILQRQGVALPPIETP